jgi:NitT/TauT family transport system permease protein
MIGGVLALGASLLMAQWRWLERALLPVAVVAKVTPVVVVAPLFVLWFGFGITSTVVITALICFFPLLENTMTAIVQVQPERLELFRMLGAGRWQTLWRLKLPSGLPGILAGVRVAVVLALVGAVVGEFIGASRGLGALVIASQGTMDTPLMFAVLLLIAALGMLAYQATLLLERWLLLPFTRTS